MPSRVTASAMITCGSLSRPSLECPRLLQRREGQAAPALGRDVLVVAFEPGGGGVVEDQVDVELEQIDAVPEHLLLDRIAVLGEDVRARDRAGRGRDPWPRAARPASSQRSWQASLEPGRARRCAVIASKRRLMRCLPLVGRQPAGDRPTDAEPGPELLDHVDDAELEARLDLDRPFTTLRVGRGRRSPSASSTRRMLRTSRSSAARSRRSARPKLCTTLASTWPFSGWRTFSASA